MFLPPLASADFYWRSY
ncbi:hypothetical protein LINPERPRIM_LOCUS15134 [Linum perenne]